jgi:RimJ/RimL family protein N-acetyltransferase
LRLTTEHLELREFDLSDIKDAAAYLSDPQVMEFVEPPFDYDKTKEFILTHGMAAEPHVYALAERPTGNLVGHVIFHRFESDRVFELGWVLRKEYWGRGSALEISRELISYGFRVLGLEKIVVETVANNLNAKKIIEKLGMVRELNSEGDLEVWSLSRPDSGC